MATVAEIWRYPVKSMAGERIPASRVTAAGLEHDRRYAFLDTQPNRAGKRLTGRQVDRLLAYRASARDGAVRVGDGESRLPIEGIQPGLEALAGRRLELIDRPGENFDDSPVLLVNLATVTRLAAAAGTSIDHRRFRANLYLGDAEPDEELEWVGARLRVGNAVLAVVSRCERCVMITIDPDTQARSPELLEVLARRHEARMGVYAQVLEPGRVAEGDPCELL